MAAGHAAHGDEVGDARNFRQALGERRQFPRLDLGEQGIAHDVLGEAGPRHGGGGKKSEHFAACRHGRSSLASASARASTR